MGDLTFAPHWKANSDLSELTPTKTPIHRAVCGLVWNHYSIWNSTKSLAASVPSFWQMLHVICHHVKHLLWNFIVHLYQNIRYVIKLPDLLVGAIDELRRQWWALDPILISNVMPWHLWMHTAYYVQPRKSDRLPLAYAEIVNTQVTLLMGHLSLAGIPSHSLTQAFVSQARSISCITDPKNALSAHLEEAKRHCGILSRDWRCLALSWGISLNKAIDLMVPAHISVDACAHGLGRPARNLLDK